MWLGRTLEVWHEDVRRCLALRPSQKRLSRARRAHEASALRALDEKVASLASELARTRASAEAERRALETRTGEVRLSVARRARTSPLYNYSVEQSYRGELKVVAAPFVMMCVASGPRRSTTT